MPTRFRILPYRQGSRSARALADNLPRGRVLRLQNSVYRKRDGDLVINWGNTGPDVSRLCDLNNDVEVLRRATNKLEFFRHHQGQDYLPEFWTNRDEIPSEAFPIVCRTVLAGHSGDGIVIADTRDDLVDAPLYVRYIKKAEEYRVHCSSTATIAIQRKARRTSVPDGEVNWRVRNHDNGFLFAREGFVTPNSVVAAAIQSLGVSGLDFGAVDVIWNARQERAYVLEINTAPGLEGQTIQDYSNFFQGI